MRPSRKVGSLATLVLYLGVATVVRAGDWPQFGGPNRDFTVASERTWQWPDEGPRVVWRRPAGEGYSQLAGDRRQLFTLLREDDEEVLLALDARSGETLWTSSYPAPLGDWLRRNRGVGPRATPLVTARSVCTAGILGTLICADRQTGRERWRRELVLDLGGSKDTRGYASSPILFGSVVIVPVGGEGQALVAFRERDGEIVWSGGDFENAMSSPRLLQVGGKTQLVTLLNGVVAGMSPDDGTVIWQHPHDAGRGERNVSMPVWGGERELFISSGYGGGSRAIRLDADGAGAEQLWASERTRVQFTNAIRRGEAVYATSGDFGPVPLTAIEAATGKVLWQERAFGKANLVGVGERALLLDEDGTLALLSLEPSGLEIHGQTQVVEEKAWTAPTVIDSRVLIRTQSQILALDFARLPRTGGAAPALRERTVLSSSSGGDHR